MTSQQLRGRCRETDAWRGGMVKPKGRTKGKRVILVT